MATRSAKQSARGRSSRQSVSLAGDWLVVVPSVGPRCSPSPQRGLARDRFLRSLPAKRHHVTRRRRYQTGDVRPPRIERVASLIEVFKTVVNSCDATDGAANMIQHLISDVRENFQLCHAGGGRSAKVV